MHKIVPVGGRVPDDCSVVVAMAISGLPYWLCKQLLHTNVVAYGTEDGAMLAFIAGCGCRATKVDPPPELVADIPTTGLFVVVIKNSSREQHLIAVEDGMACDASFWEPLAIEGHPYSQKSVLRMWSLS